MFDLVAAILTSRRYFSDSRALVGNISNIMLTKIIKGESPLVNIEVCITFWFHDTQTPVVNLNVPLSLIIMEFASGLNKGGINL